MKLAKTLEHPLDMWFQKMNVWGLQLLLLLSLSGLLRLTQASQVDANPNPLTL